MKYILLLLIVLGTPLAHAKIDINFVPKNISQGNAVELIISSDTPFQGVPNLNVLENDFVIGGQQRSQSAQWINGKGSTTYQLIYTLFPNKSGDIVVKGLKIGNELLPEATLTVGRDATLPQEGNVLMTIDYPNSTLYPSQRLLCQVTLEDTIGVLDGEAFAPTTEVGSWEQVLAFFPDDKHNGKSKLYHSIFAFTPTKSGQITVPPFTFKGQASLQTSGPKQARSILDFMVLVFQNTATKPVAAQTKPFQLTIKEKPENYQGWWLPSSQVTLTTKDTIPTPIHIGEPITRTLTLFAKDIAAANLPVPTVPQTNGFKVYTNPEQRQDLPNGAALTVDLTFVPTQAGSNTLPAISVPWFNVNTQTIQNATLPSKNIQVAAEPAEPSSTQSEQNSQIDQPTQEPAEPVDHQEQPPQQNASIPWLLLILSVCCAFIAGIVIAWFIFKKHQQKTLSNKKKAPLPDLYPF